MKIATVILLLIISLSASAESKILFKNFAVTEKNDVYTITATATLKGDYNRFIQRMMDVDNYLNMNVPYIVATRKILDTPHRRIVWFHTSTFLTEAKYYLGFDYTLGKNKADVAFRLLSKSAAYPNEHDYAILSGHMMIKILSGGPHNCTYTLQSVTQLKLDEDALDIPEITINKLKTQADGGLQAFAK